jgi:hypothetical protein
VGRLVDKSGTPTSRWPRVMELKGVYMETCRPHMLAWHVLYCIRFTHAVGDPCGAAYTRDTLVNTASCRQQKKESPNNCAQKQDESEDSFATSEQTLIIS